MVKSFKEFVKENVYIGENFSSFKDGDTVHVQGYDKPHIVTGRNVMTKHLYHRPADGGEGRYLHHYSKFSHAKKNESLDEQKENVYIGEDTVDNLIYHANHPDPKKSRKAKKKLQAYLDGVKNKISQASGTFKW